ncbi:MAG: bifunctional heptose 7-phosphate kinase/heptose 1-phosphate adenyltransferase [Desulfuromonas sp.]|nr:MAG: bifunctional heptose 7-phosphate kinase/heptose 1-phosphate adenyltransferase [Desulfuromonas sp.]
MDRIVVERFLGELAELKVLVVGDLMLDEYLWGQVERISPEAPVQVVAVRREELRLGGAGNVLNNLVALGAQVTVASVLGDDADGRLLREQLAGLGVDPHGIVLAPGRTTSRKTRVLASNQQIVRIDRETRASITPDQERQLLSRIETQLPECRVVLVSDYLKGVLPESLLQAIIQLTRQAGVPVVVDPKGDDYRKYRGATVLTPNRKEAEVASGVRIDDDASLAKAGEGLLRELDLDALVLTRSEAGMSLFFRDSQTVHLPTEAKEVFDVSGAGDTVLALVGLGLAAGLSLEQAAWLSNVAAGIVVGKVGTSTVVPAEIIAAVGRRHQDSDLKIHGRQPLATLLADRRARGERVVFTNGCFDLLHAGHIKYLQAARRLGDLLVLGLNSDASIRRLKGEKRPLIEQDERAHLLAALGCIDFVTVFDEDTPLELISTLRPDILVKGGDYTPEGVVGKDLVESWGGRVELIEFVDGKSTTSLIEKILSAYQE